MYTPIFSRHFTMPSGVQGRMDLTVPSGGTSSVLADGAPVSGALDRSEFGSRYLMLQCITHVRLTSQKKKLGVCGCMRTHL